ncbi:hypothetical protein JHW43_006044 [Diplocarpon mali]|nr:hypothetical protein JHW43_006044 [Diplocarpon mali]
MRKDRTISHDCAFALTEVAVPWLYDAGVAYRAQLTRSPLVTKLIGEDTLGFLSKMIGAFITGLDGLDGSGDPPAPKQVEFSVGSARRLLANSVTRKAECQPSRGADGFCSSSFQNPDSRFQARRWVTTWSVPQPNISIETAGLRLAAEALQRHSRGRTDPPGPAMEVCFVMPRIVVFT